MHPTTALVTPEAVVLDLPTASPGTRALARVIDMVASAGAIYFLVVILGLAAIGLGGLGATAVVILVAFGLFAVLLVYPVLMETLWGGKTLGKAVFGLRVVRMDGGPVGFGHAVIRAALGLVEIWATAGSLGFLVMLFSPQDQRLGDMAAGTLVLRDRQGASLRPVQLLVPPGCEQLVMTMDVGAMTLGDYELVRSFLVRWRDFPVQRRPAVAAPLAGPLWQRFHHAVPSWLGPDYYLACLGAAYQYRHRSGAFAPAPATGPWGTTSGNAASTRGEPTGGYGGPSGGYGGPSGGYGGPSGAYGEPSGGYGEPSDGYGEPSGGYGGPSDWAAPR